MSAVGDGGEECAYLGRAHKSMSTKGLQVFTKCWRSPDNGTLLQPSVGTLTPASDSAAKFSLAANDKQQGYYHRSRKLSPYH